LWFLISCATQDFSNRLIAQNLIERIVSDERFDRFALCCHDASHVRMACMVCTAFLYVFLQTFDALTAKFAMRIAQTFLLWFTLETDE
jgi:hypothetical protein